MIITTDQVGLTFTPNTTEEEFIAIGKELAQAGNSLSWATGDWYRQIKSYGKTQAICKAAGINPATAKNYGRTCKAYPTLESRYAELSFQHHRIVAGIPEPVRTELLEKAISDNLSCTKLIKLKKFVLSGKTEPATVERPHSTLAHVVMEFTKLTKKDKLLFLKIIDAD